MPFWSLLMLLRCKIRLDGWLQHTLYELQELRRELIQPEQQSQLPPQEGGPRLTLSSLGGSSEAAAKRQHEEEIAKAQEQIVARLGAFIVDYQDLFSELWSGQCEPLVFYATRLLWSSACGAILLTGVMFWLFLVNRPGNQNSAHIHFLVLLVAGFMAPAFWLLSERCRKAAAPPPPADGPLPSGGPLAQQL